MPEYEGKVNAPEFPDGMEWLNTDRPLAIRQLRGKVVLLDFWTFCCINCMHIYKLNAQAPTALSIATESGQAILLTSGDQAITNPKFPVTVPIKAIEGDVIVKVGFIIYYCEAAKESLCYFKEARLTLPVKVIKGTGSNKLSVTYN